MPGHTDMDERTKVFDYPVMDHLEGPVRDVLVRSVLVQGGLEPTTCRPTVE